MSDNKDGFEIGDLSVEISQSGNSIWFTSIGDPYDAPVLYTKDLNEFYERLGEMVRHLNNASTYPPIAITKNTPLEQRIGIVEAWLIENGYSKDCLVSFDESEHNVLVVDVQCKI